MENKKTGLMIYEKLMVSLSTVSTVSLEEPDFITIMLVNDRIIQIDIAKDGEFKTEYTGHYFVPVNEFHRIKRELEEYFGVTFN
ncbi:hypothetical protein [Photobacterium kishitanii]|uniref:hypothetical protein n=1 Tax=Photobacterium kishitanii TaxID=318456 RepID=UPI0007F8F850|nr:hypothetical protein [Photobacterium kishitanii]OBU30155.1 hypothetical protein AYY23_21850 [Photobacterium kishitanii]PSW46786.1 hypothetical protein C0W66_21605 [Photobacterium kishitanii]